MANNGEVLLNGLGNAGPPPKDASKEKKGPDTLFGPNIGVISGGPAWTNATEKKILKDELTMDVVKAWVEKSKQPSQPTTTLQALVNLKRPTIRLSPLANTEAEDSHSQNHALEFEYDCDAPKCGIYVHVLLPPGHPDAPPSAPTLLAGDAVPGKLSKLLVFESVVDGGFGKKLKMEEGAGLELGRYDITRLEKQEDPNPRPSHSTSDASVPTEAPVAPGPNAPNYRRKRLTHLFTKRHNNRNMSVSGPALAVVDASSPDTARSDASDKSKKDDTEEGIKVTIRLAALDEHATELASPNEQSTYLSVERFGTKTKSAPAAVNNNESNPEEGKADGAAAAAEVKPEEEEDTRPWVVKVVKREATIGPHTFHLHEIYGLTLSSSSSHTHAPTAPLPSAHTYPPAAGTVPVVETNDATDDSPSECLLCLSSPREVVLLPCRHLVACKDCALNMVEFGAGGNITQVTEDTAAGGDGAADAGERAPSATPAAPVPLPTTRRKRKAKGWFCPVCRQPYTSLLRITTNPPPVAGQKPEATAGGQEESDDDERDGAGDQDIADTSLSGGLPTTAEQPQPQATAEANSGGIFRPGFLRGLTGRANASRGDLENQL